MASITIRNLEDGVKAGLRRRAAGHGNSIEEEARLILAGAVAREAAERVTHRDSRAVQTVRRRGTGLAAAPSDAGVNKVRLRRSLVR